MSPLMSGRCAAPLLVAFIVLLATPTFAEDLPSRTALRLTYEGGGLKGCPDEQVFRDVMRAHMSYDPFSPSAETRLVVTIVRAGQAYLGRAELRDKAGAVLWPRALPPFTDCYSVVEGLGFAVSVKLDPVGDGGPKPPPSLQESKPPEPNPPRTDEPEPMSVTPAVRPWINVGAALVLGLGLGAAPRPAVGVAVDVGLRLPSWPDALWISLEARAFPPAEGQADVGPTRFRTWQATGAVVPCGHWSVLFGCGVAEMGALWGTTGTSDTAHPQTARLFHFALGARAGAEWQALPHLALRLSGDALLSPVRQRLEVEGELQWVTPLLSAAFEAGVVASF